MHSVDNRVLVDDINGCSDTTLEDPVLAFIEYASSVLCPLEEQGQLEEEEEDLGEYRNGPGWNWITSRILKTCISYSSGVTSAILLSELSQVYT